MHFLLPYLYVLVPVFFFDIQITAPIFCAVVVAITRARQIKEVAPGTSSIEMFRRTLIMSAFSVSVGNMLGYLAIEIWSGHWFGFNLWRMFMAVVLHSIVPTLIVDIYYYRQEFEPYDVSNFESRPRP